MENIEHSELMILWNDIGTGISEALLLLLQFAFIWLVYSGSKFLFIGQKIKSMKALQRRLVIGLGGILLLSYLWATTAGEIKECDGWDGFSSNCVVVDEVPQTPNDLQKNTAKFFMLMGLPFILAFFDGKRALTESKTEQGHKRLFDKSTKS